MFRFKHTSTMHVTDILVICYNKLKMVSAFIGFFLILKRIDERAVKFARLHFKNVKTIRFKVDTKKKNLET